MLTNHPADKPSRVVILGAKGFVGHAAQQRFIKENIAVLALGRQELNLLDDQAAEQLKLILKPQDTLVFAAAQAPCKNYAMLINNLRMMQTLSSALETVPLRHLIYISSDAVYSDSNQPLNECSATQPDSLHGIMHLTRELLLNATAKNTPLAILRPSLLYGVNDPHNGYGPNQFRRLTQQASPITLFGEGEERRDHVFIDDVAQLIYLTALHRSEGILNIASGNVFSFRQIAEMVQQLADKPIAIQSRPRSGPMPHNGYRAFDVSACQQAFAGFHPTPLAEGLQKVYQQQLQKDCV